MMDYGDEDRPSPSRDVLRERRLAEAKESLAKRLQPVCSHLSAAQFEELIDGMAENQIRHDGKAVKWRIDN